MATKTDVVEQFCQMGVSGLDDILGGKGLPRGCLYLVDGEPGTGKTTLAIQFLLEGARHNERCLYIGLSETPGEIGKIAESHGWDLSSIQTLDINAVRSLRKPGAQGTLFQPAEVELNQTTDALVAAIEKANATRVVFDSVAEMRLLAGSSIRYRRQMLSLKQFFAKLQSTVLILDDRTSDDTEFQVKSIVHGVLHLEVTEPDYGVERRRFRVGKVRGLKYRGGFHDYSIERGGLILYPRLIASEHIQKFEKDMISSGVAGIDALLGGGLDRGTSSLFLGPAGTGKSTIALQYAHAAAKRGEKVALYVFEENVGSLIMRAEALGLSLEGHIAAGLIIIQKIDPAGKSPGQFTHDMRKLCTAEDVKLVILDSLNGYVHSMPAESYVTMQLHELLAYLAHKGVATIIVLAQQGLVGMMNTPVDLTYIADTVLVTRYFEASGSVKKAVSVIKKRTGTHESTIRELTIQSGKGVTVGEPLHEFHGVLTGIPYYGAPLKRA